MTEPTLAMTCEDHLIAVAEVLGLAYYGRPVALGTADSAGASTLVDAARTEANDYFNGGTLLISGGTGAGQSKTVTDFVNATGTFTISGTWDTTPDSTSTYRAVPAPSAVTMDAAAQVPMNTHDFDLCLRLVNDGYRRFVNGKARWNWQTPNFTIVLAAGVTGTATAGAAASLTDTGLGTTYAADYFNGWTIAITGGTGAGQTPVTVTDYDGAGKFTVAAWGVQPDTTSEYSVAPSQCVAGEAWRYSMPDGFYGSLIGRMTYPTSGPRIDLEVVDEYDIRAERASGNVTGDPSKMAIRPISTNTRLWEAVFWPTPSAAHILTGRCRLLPNKLAGLADKTNCGPVFDEAVKACCQAEAERSRKDGAHFYLDALSDVLARAFAIDNQGAPRTVGYNADRSDGRLGLARHPYTGVDTYTSLDGTIHNL